MNAMPCLLSQEWKTESENEMEELVKMRAEIRELKQIVKDAVAPRYTLRDAETQTMPEDLQNSEPFGHWHVLSAEKISQMQEQYQDPRHFAAAVLREISTKFRKIIINTKGRGVSPL
jgi:hypothetical protein